MKASQSKATSATRQRLEFNERYWKATRARSPQSARMKEKEKANGDSCKLEVKINDERESLAERAVWFGERLKRSSQLTVSRRRNSRERKQELGR